MLFRKLLSAIGILAGLGGILWVIGLAFQICGGSTDAAFPTPTYTCPTIPPASLLLVGLIAFVSLTAISSIVLAYSFLRPNHVQRAKP